MEPYYVPDMVYRLSLEKGRLMECRILIYIDKNNITQTDKTIRSIGELQDSYSMVIADDIADGELSESLIEDLSDIAGDNISYIQNDQYLGYGATINSIAGEDNMCDWLVMTAGTIIDCEGVNKLRQMLYLSDTNIIAVPRSNKGLLATYPYSDYRFCRESNLEESRELFNKGNADMSDVTVLPFVSSFCLIFRANTFVKYGRLSENTSDPVSCILGYSLSVLGTGGRLIMANHVYAENNCSYEENAADIPQLNDTILIYERSYQEAEDYFASLIYRKQSRKLKLLYFMVSVSDMYNGTSEHDLSLLEQLTNRYSDKYDITVVAKAKAIEFHHIREKYSNVVLPEELTGIYDIGFCPFMFYDIRHQITMSRHCYKIVGWNLDMIMYRCNYLFAKQNYIDSHYRLADMLVDGYITNSESVSKDMRELLGESEFIRNKQVQPILLAVNETKYDTNEDVPFDRYILVMGNSFKHKAIADTIPYLQISNHNFIVFGAESTGPVTDNIYGYRSGYLTNEFVYYLYSHCDGLLFPSVYEGFGLPIIRALNLGKEVLINDNFLNREIISYFTDVADHIHTYRRFSEIPQLVNQLRSGFEEGMVDRNWGDVADDVNSFLDAVMGQQTDINALNYRYDNFTVCEGITECLDVLNARMEVFTKVKNIIQKEIDSDNSDDDKINTIQDVVKMVCGG